MGVVLFLPWLGATNDVRRQSLPDRVTGTNLPGVGDNGSVPARPESFWEHTDVNYLTLEFNKDS